VADGSDRAFLGAPASAGRAARRWRVRFAKARRLLSRYVFSSVARTILIINLAGLAALLLGILYLNQFRAGLIEARVESLLVQGEILAAAIAGGASVERGALTVDPTRLLEDLTADPDMTDEPPPAAFDLNPARIAPILHRLVQPARLRARVYDRDGYLVLDSRFLVGGDVFQAERPAPPPDLMERAWRWIRRLVGRDDLPRYRELGASEGRDYAEVAQSLQGVAASVVRVNDRDELIVSVAVPVSRQRMTVGALMLSTQGGEIDEVVDGERAAILRVFLVAAGVMSILSLLLSGSIAGPLRRLAGAAERVARGTRAREEIPDFTDRQDEIGHLSGALRDMTGALYDRIEAIERFAADVAHELKNPLTSLRSAVETLPLAKREQDRARLLDIIRHDVKRLDRLITDISEASRLDAELQREGGKRVDLGRVLGTVVTIQNDTRREDEAMIALALAPGPLGGKAFLVDGHESRLGQVFANLIDNAKSFSPGDGTVRVTARREGGVVEVTVDDDGPGISVEPIERIFERFYTDRPQTSFGNNSGLGLSISKQIVEAHRGTILAENRVLDGHVAGARFTVRLPGA
jgi:two-component system sensor histidine kinase ChvG